MCVWQATLEKASHLLLIFCAQCVLTPSPRATLHRDPSSPQAERAQFPRQSGSLFCFRTRPEEECLLRTSEAFFLCETSPALFWDSRWKNQQRLLAVRERFVLANSTCTGTRVAMASFLIYPSLFNDPTCCENTAHATRPAPASLNRALASVPSFLTCDGTSFPLAAALRTTAAKLTHGRLFLERCVLF